MWTGVLLANYPGQCLQLAGESFRKYVHRLRLIESPAEFVGVTAKQALSTRSRGNSALISRRLNSLMEPRRASRCSNSSSERRKHPSRAHSTRRPRKQVRAAAKLFLNIKPQRLSITPVFGTDTAIMQEIAAFSIVFRLLHRDFAESLQRRRAQLLRSADHGEYVARLNVTLRVHKRWAVA